MNSFYDLSLSNLLSLYHTEEQSFLEGDFKNSVGETFFPEKEAVIEFLIKNDLIEYEAEEKRYYLSPETYDLIENSELEDFIWRKIGEEERKRHEQNNYPQASRELNYKIVSPESEQVPKKQPFLSNASHPVKAIVLTSIIMLIYYLNPFGNLFPRAEQKPLSPDEVKFLNRVTLVNEEGDTLSLGEKINLVK